LHFTSVSIAEFLSSGQFEKQLYKKIKQNTEDAAENVKSFALANSGAKCI
jgi:hypothetical protein